MQLKIPDVHRVPVKGTKSFNQPGREVVVQQQFHALGRSAN
jgi:hypothetical protein